MIKAISVFPILASLFFLVACGPSTKEELDMGDNSNSAGYPPPASISNESYPVPTQIISSYPVPIVKDESKRFTISEPLRAGSTEVMGTGPFNTPIKVINISFVGETLGSGVVDSEGAFRISLSQPLEANHVIGLQLSDQNLEPSFLDGPDYTNIPMIGLVLTQTVVEP